MRHMDNDSAKLIIAFFLGDDFTETQVDEAYEYAEKVLSSLIDAHEIFANEFGKHFKFKQLEIALILSLYCFLMLVTPDGNISGYMKAYDVAFSRMWECLIDSAIKEENLYIKHSAERP